jgi:hypothetical protein
LRSAFSADVVEVVLTDPWLGDYSFMVYLKYCNMETYYSKVEAYSLFRLSSEIHRPIIASPCHTALPLIAGEGVASGCI